MQVFHSYLTGVSQMIAFSGETGTKAADASSPLTKKHSFQRIIFSCGGTKTFRGTRDDGLVIKTLVLLSTVLLCMCCILYVYYSD